MASPDEWVDWLDEEGRVRESLPRAEIRRRNLLHPVSSTFVFHPDGRLYLHQRTMSKDLFPGLFAVNVGGTLVSGETYAGNACREIAEELGVRGVPIYELFRHRWQDAHTNSIIREFACIYDGPISHQPEEVASGFWASPAQADELIWAGNVCPDSAQGWRLYLDRFGTDTPFAHHAAGLPSISCEGQAEE